MRNKMKTKAINLLTNKIIHHAELILFLAALFIANISLISGNIFSGLIFSPADVSTGEWWRIFTYPFVHVSWYHLILDAGSFMLLYHGLLESSWIKRILYVFACSLGSLGISLLSPDIYNGGLCGLSGVAHGLMAVSALEMAMSEDIDINLQRIGLAGFTIVVIKSIIEMLTGKVIFAFMHFGDVGTPLTICHAGGVLAGTIAFITLRNIARK
jgi:rhomboid family GlyGly-CTERM serine protease